MLDSHSEIVCIGLGNPGKRYALTRHNMGFLVVEELARSLGWVFKEEKRLNAQLVKGRLNGKNVCLLLPTTYMNESGWAVKQYLDYYKVPSSQIVVVSDDIALEFGQMRLRLKGSAGGHNGLKSVISHLGTEEFIRLRMGIGDRREGLTLSDYVLDNFTPQELADLNAFIGRGALMLRELTIATIEQLMNRVNKPLA